MPPEQRSQVAPAMADAYASTFWWALGLVVIAFVVALVLLPREKPSPVYDPDEGEPGSVEPEPAVLLTH